MVEATGRKAANIGMSGGEYLRKRHESRRLARGPPRGGVYGTRCSTGGVLRLGQDDMVMSDSACFVEWTLATCSLPWTIFIFPRK